MKALMQDILFGSLDTVMNWFGYTTIVSHNYLYPGMPDKIEISIFRKDWKARQEGRQYAGIDPKTHYHA